MTVTIGRRDVIAALGGATAAWPLTARAQQVPKLLRVGTVGLANPRSGGLWAPIEQARVGICRGTEFRNRVHKFERSNSASRCIAMNIAASVAYFLIDLIAGVVLPSFAMWL